jgi:RNA polymerase sigma-70 factor, ECF subfamily
MVMLAITESSVFEPISKTGGDHTACAATGARPSGSQTSDEALIAAIAEGDRGAMKLLYARHHVRLYRFVLRITANPTLAEDIVSEAFLDVWRQADGFKGRSQVSTWLLAIARNKAISALRRRCDEQLDDLTAAEIEDPADDAELLVQNKDRSTVIRKCLSELPTAQREVIDLVYYHDKSVAEVAKIVGVGANTVKTRMFYARQRMQALLRDAGLNGV